MTGHARRVGIFGGTFDPVHNGHLDVGDAACLALDLERLLVITSNVPPHRPQPAASSHHRFAMVSMALAGRPGWRASDLELRATSQSFTTATLKKFHDRGFSPTELFFVLGADAFAEIGAWRDYPAILDAAHFAVVSRPGIPVGTLRERLPEIADRMVLAPLDQPFPARTMIVLIDAPTADVSASAIRQRRGEGRSLAGLVPAAVQQHIEQHGLYTPMTPGRRAADAPQSAEADRLHGQD